jgi:molybdopterin converting factor small subunit
MEQLPEAVRKAKENAERLIKQAQGVDVGTPVMQAPTEITLIDEQQTTTIDAVNTGNPAHDANLSNQQTQHDKPINLKEIDDVEQLRQMLMQEQQRNNVLQGKYKAEVPRYAETERQLREQLAIAMNQLGSIQATNSETNQQQPVKPTADEINLSDYYSEDTIDSYDEGYLRDQIVAQMKLMAPVKQQLSQTQHELAQSRTDNFLAKLESSAPDFRQKWEDQDGFQNWLNTPVTGAEFDFMVQRGITAPMGVGITKKDVLNAEYNAQNALGAAAIFSLYQPRLIQQQVNGGIPTNIQQQIVPRTAGSIETPTAQPGKKIYSGAEFRALKSALATNQIRGDRAEKLSLELNQAIAENRIRG